MRCCIRSSIWKSGKASKSPGWMFPPTDLIDPDALDQARSVPDTTLVSIMTANNETGVIQPMAEIAARCREHGVLLHSDMVQSFGKLPVIPSAAEGSRGANFKVTSRIPRLPRSAGSLRMTLVDAASFGAHKFYGPKGVGFLLSALRPADRSDSIWRLARRRTPSGNGERPRDRRDGGGRGGGLEGICLTNKRDRHSCATICGGASRKFSRPRNKTARARRASANTLNVSFPGFSSETLLMALDLEGRLRLERLGLHGRFGGRLACSARDGSAAGTRRVGRSLFVRQRNDRAGNRADGRGHRAHPAAIIARRAGIRSDMLSFSQLEFSLSRLPFPKKPPAAIRRWKRSPAICSSKTAPRPWPRECGWNGRRACGPPPVAPNTAPRASCSTVVCARTVQLRLI